MQLKSVGWYFVDKAKRKELLFYFSPSHIKELLFMSMTLRHYKLIL